MTGVEKGIDDFTDFLNETVIFYAKPQHSTILPPFFSPHCFSIVPQPLLTH